MKKDMEKVKTVVEHLFIIAMVLTIWSMVATRNHVDFATMLAGSAVICLISGGLMSVLYATINEILSIENDES